MNTGSRTIDEIQDFLRMPARGLGNFLNYYLLPKVKSASDPVMMAGSQLHAKKNKKRKMNQHRDASLRNDQVNKVTR